VTLADCGGAQRAALPSGPDDHYDQISAFIKSVRGSDADAGSTGSPHARGGEDARFIASGWYPASEDVAWRRQRPRVADAAARAVEMVGLPEAALNLAQALCTWRPPPSRTGSPWPSGSGEDARSGEG